MYNNGTRIGSGIGHFPIAYCGELRTDRLGFAFTAANILFARTLSGVLEGLGKHIIEKLCNSAVLIC